MNKKKGSKNKRGFSGPSIEEEYGRKDEVKKPKERPVWLPKWDDLGVLFNPSNPFSVFFYLILIAMLLIGYMKFQ